MESIKLIYWTLSSLGDGPGANAPVDEEAKRLIESTINDVTLQLMSRTLILSNLATTLALAQGTNPLRPMRYLMNCILKIWETKLSDLVRPLAASPCMSRMHVVRLLFSRCACCVSSPYPLTKCGAVHGVSGSCGVVIVARPEAQCGSPGDSLSSAHSAGSHHAGRRRQG